MSPTDKGANTPESPETPEPNGEPTPNEAAPVEPIAEEAAEAPAAEVPAAEAPAAEAPASTPTYGEAPLAGGAPITYPSPDSFASANAPAANNKKVLAIIGGLVAVVVIAVVAGLLVWAPWSSDDSSPEAQIKQVTADYVDVMNSGQLTKVPALFCEAQASQAPADLADQPAPAQQVLLGDFSDIKIDGDNATATISISAKDDDTIPAESVPMTYTNENGWKICPQ